MTFPTPVLGRPLWRSARSVLAIGFLGVASATFSLLAQDFLEPAKTLSVRPLDPVAGPVIRLAQLTVQFSEEVTGVDAADLWINGVPATGYSASGDTYTFQFPPPSLGTVQVGWNPACGIRSLQDTNLLFDPFGVGNRWYYELVDPNPPVVVALEPPAGTVLRSLGEVQVWFDRPVEGVDAADLLVSGRLVSSVTGAGAGPYLFRFDEILSQGVATLSWTAQNGIRDALEVSNPFPGGSWEYTVDPAREVGDVVINEIMAENTVGLRDEEGEQQDWIELLNRGSAAVDLSGWSMSDDPAQPGQWVFPEVILPAHGYLVLYASGKDRRNPAGKLHTNFKLGLAGEYLGLYGPDSPRKVVAEMQPRYPEQRNDVSYGRDSSGGWRYFAASTPGVSNGSSRISTVVAPVHFSVRRGYYAQGLNLGLYTDTSGADIYYTLDGSIPKPTNGLRYTSPIVLSSTRVVRAAAFKADSLPSAVETHTYLVNLPGSRLNLPVLSLVTASNHLYGKTGIMEYSPRNTTKYGIAWERPVSAELIRPEDNGGFQVDCGIRVHGGGYVRGIYNYRASTAPENKYSFQLYFRTDYGPGKLEYPFFPGSAVTSFDNLVLRAGMNDPTNPFLRDEFLRRLELDTGNVTPHGNFVHLFLNGTYKGYYNPTERIDPNFLQAWHGGGDKWDLMAAGGEVREGDAVAWNALKTLISTKPLSVMNNYLEVERRLDLTNFVDYLLPNIYADTDDWPHNNWRAGRERLAGAPFRFYAWDAEWSFGYSHGSTWNTIANQLSTTAPPWGTAEIAIMFNKLKVVPEFRLLFADRIHRHFFNGGALTDERIRARYESTRKAIATSIAGFNNTIATTWIPSRRKSVTNHFALAGLLGSSNAPVLSQFGGVVPRGFSLKVSARAGSIYYTTNGRDPRVRFTGEVDSTAAKLLSGGGFPISRSMEVKARSLAGTNWSALTQAAFRVDEMGTRLRISELMYHPPGGEAFEYLELVNAGFVEMDIGGWQIEGIGYRFPMGIRIPSGGRFLLASSADPEAFAKRYPDAQVHAYFNGSLSNGGERLRILDLNLRPVLVFDYSDSYPWPEEADGGGYSLEVVDPEGTPSDPTNWRASSRLGGTPGFSGVPEACPPVRMNEISFTGARGTAGGWVELYNSGSKEIVIGGWRLVGTHRTNLFQFPTGTTIPAQGYVVVYADGNTGGDGHHGRPDLVVHPGFLCLFDAAGARMDGQAFGQQASAYSLSRFGEGYGYWHCGEPTRGAENRSAAMAEVSELALNEVLGNSLPGEPDWIEIYNRSSSQPADLYGFSLQWSNAAPVLTEHSVVPPLGFALLFADGTTAPGHLPENLPAVGAEVRLLNPSGVAISSLAYRVQPERTSTGFLPDGGGNLTDFSGAATPGAPNGMPAYEGPVIQEIMAAGTVIDWVELYNPSASVVALEGMVLGIEGKPEKQWVFPKGVTMPAGSRFVLYCDPTVAPSTSVTQNLQTGFGLPREGCVLQLKLGVGRIVSSVEFGPQIADKSFGVVAGQWRLAEYPTPGLPNSPAAVLGEPVQLRINEWLASPGGDDWVELFNTADRPVELTGLYLTDDLSLSGRTNHSLPPHSYIDARGWVVLAASPDGNAALLPFRLDWRGEPLGLYLSPSILLDRVEISPLVDGGSQGRFPDGGEGILPFPGSPSPGYANHRLFEQVVINEILPQARAPREAAIELRNLGSKPIDLSGWYLSDRGDQAAKFRIPANTLLPARGFLVFYEAEFCGWPLTEQSLVLDPVRPTEVFLSEANSSGALTGWRARAKYSAMRLGLSTGWFSTSQGESLGLLAATTLGVENPASVTQFREGKGGKNSGPLVGPVVIQEIFSDPVRPYGPAIEPELGEFVELMNFSQTAVVLGGGVAASGKWRLLGDVEFEFAPGFTLEPGALVVVVGFDPDADPTSLGRFRDYFRVEPTAVVVGPWRGRLSNEGDDLRLVEVDQSSPTDLVEYERDRVGLRSGFPWPLATGKGLSLQKLLPETWGSDPANWLAGRPTPGTANRSAFGDSDSDGLDDTWEWTFGLNPWSADGDDGSAGDSDEDGLTNVAEESLGTNPRSLDLAFVSAVHVGGVLKLRFNAIKGYSYTLQSKPMLGDGDWAVITNFMPSSSTRLLEAEVSLPQTFPASFLRMVLWGGN